MKYIITLFFLCFAFLNYKAQSLEENYINYYAVNNSIDGQIMIDRMNILRFFPVFTFYRDVTGVETTIYYGTKIIKSTGVSVDNNKYWNSILPEFKLGESIQKIEIEMTMKLPDTVFLNYKKSVEKIANEVTKKLKKEINCEIEKVFNSMDTLYNALNETKSYVGKYFDENKYYEQKRIDDEKNLQNVNLDLTSQNLKIGLESVASQKTKHDEIVKNLKFVIKDQRDSFSNAIKKDTCKKSLTYSFINLSSDTSKINDLIDSLKNIYISYDIEKLERQIKNLDSICIRLDLSGIDSIKSAYKKLEKRMGTYTIDEDRLTTTIKKDMDSVVAQMNAFNRTISNLSQNILVGLDKREEITTRIHNEITDNLKDTTFIGQSVRPSDIYVNNKLSEVKILYRNYKYNLRRMQALDPQETMGIFRARYIPFPITSIKENANSLELIPFQGENSQTVFEIGLAFGDAVIPSDDFVAPKLSFDRLGLAIGLSQKLFEEDADIKALAFTYDFNTYSSIGIGGNFAHHIIKPYFSIGINKKAFEALLKGIVGIFK